MSTRSQEEHGDLTMNHPKDYEWVFFCWIMDIVQDGGGTV